MIATPSTTSTTPVARFKVAGLALLAKRAAMRAHNSVDPTQNTRHHRFGIPPMAKWLTAPVKAVKVIMNTLVPTAVFSSYPSTLVSSRSIIIPPPAPTKPQMKPTADPQPPLDDVKEKFEQALEQGSQEEVVIHEFCDRMQIPFEKISSEDFSAFLRILSLSKMLKNPNNMRGKAKPQPYYAPKRKKRR